MGSSRNQVEMLDINLNLDVHIILHVTLTSDQTSVHAFVNTIAQCVSERRATSEVTSIIS